MLRAKVLTVVAGLLASHLAALCGYSQGAAPTQILITNARVFDGKSDTLADGMNVLIEGNKIAKVSRPKSRHPPAPW